MQNYTLENNISNQDIVVKCKFYPSTFMIISADEGGRIVKLCIDDQDIIVEPENKAYSESYAASWLFPFTNRIEDGFFEFQDNKYQLFCNNIEENNALHGLIYDQKFEIIKYEEQDNYSEIILKYFSDGLFTGFPFKFEIFITYKLSKFSLTSNFKVINLDITQFPFAIGWHPYFNTSNKLKTFLKFEGINHLKMNQRNIPQKKETFSGIQKILFSDNYDDCFEIANNEVYLQTPDYQINFNLSNNLNYLQIYTPSKSNTIAIEPMTAPANSFNNKWGYKIIKPNEQIIENFQITFIKNT